jgi:P4 family phage/plasmid primase-like protien
MTDRTGEVFNFQSTVHLDQPGNPIFDAALDYINQGYSFVRVTPGDKKVQGYWKEYQERLPTETEVRAWFKRKYYQIGVVCGPVSGGLFILDFDGKHWEEYFELFGQRFPDLLTTRYVSTGSGKVHLWYKCPTLLNVMVSLGLKKVVKRKFPVVENGVSEAIELRLNHVQCVAPPSIHPSGNPYVFIDEIPAMQVSQEKLIELVHFMQEGQTEIHEPTEPIEIPDLNDERKNRLAEFYVRCAIKRAENGNGRNNSAYILGCNLRDLGLTEEEATPFIQQYREQCPAGDHDFTLDEAINCVESAFQGDPKPPWIPDGFFGPDPSDFDEQRIATLMGYHLTDAGNAEAFLNIHGHRFYHIPERKSWYMWDGVRWMLEEQAARDAMLDTTRIRASFSDRIDTATVNGRDHQQKYLRWTRNSENFAKINSALDSAAYKKYKSINLFDAQPYILACTNGLVNLRTGEFQIAKANNFISKSTFIEFNPNAQCPRWLEFLDEITLEDKLLIGFLKRMVGYSLTGDVSEHYMVMFLGGGANGKSTFLEAISSVLGEYAQTAPSSLLKEKRGGDDIPTDVARLCGIRFTKIVEMKERVTLNAERLKALTGGDKITARFLHENFFEFNPQFKLWLAVNHKPTIRDTSEAIWRRIGLVDFKAYFPPEKQDKHLIDLLRSEASGILNWAVEGCLEWQESGLNPPDSVKAATQAYRDESDDVARFLEEICVKEEQGQVDSNELYEAFSAWWKDTINDTPWEKKTLYGKLKEKGHKVIRLNRHTIVVRGLTLKP